MRICLMSLLLAVGLAACESSLRSNEVSDIGPRLDAIPMPTIRGQLPEPAAWPVLRHERPLRFLVLMNKIGSLAPYQRVARRARASLDVRFVGGAMPGDARYHLQDKWIEPPPAPEIDAAMNQSVLDALPPDGAAPYDVVFVDSDDAELQKRLLAFMNRGGVVVVNSSFYPTPGTPLAPLWPATPDKANNWMTGGSKHTAEPEIAGIPTQMLTAHTWIPIPHATNEARTLITGAAGTMFVRTVGKGSLVFCPTGLITHRYDFFWTITFQYDEDEIWLRAWDQLLHSLVQGPAVLPVMVDAQLKDKPGATGATLAVKTIRRATTGPLVASLHVVAPDGRVVLAQPLALPANDAAIDVPIAFPPTWGAGIYRAFVTVGDSTTKRQLHQALEFVPVEGTVKLALTTDKTGYRICETARFTVTGSSREPFTGELTLGVYDFRGRLLHAVGRAVTLDQKNATATFEWKMADHGVRVDTMWAVVAATKNKTEYGRATARVYKADPWSMRNEYQWSTWARMSCSTGSGVLPAMTLMAHAGMNALGYPGSMGLSYPAERWSWRYYNEGIGMNTFSPLIDQDSDAGIESSFAKSANTTDPDLRSAAFVIGSVGEEAGYQSGWGRTYYWPGPEADEKGSAAFRWFLKDRYKDLASLNTAWHTNYAAWGDVKLTREFSGAPPKPDADGWAQPKEPPAGARSNDVSYVPYSDTAYFYGWYYDHIIAAAKKIFHERTNPVTLTVASAPSSATFASRECDIQVSGPGSWNESQMHALADPVEPTFALVWGHFDLSMKTEDLFWGFLLQRTGHQNYWVDIPLMFNNDMTHTRATMAMRRWVTNLSGRERIILDSRRAPTDVGVLGVSGVIPGQLPGDMNASVQVAVMQSGFHCAQVDADHLGRYKIVFAVARYGVSSDEAEKMSRFVEAGGTLVVADRFASQDQFGVVQKASPGSGLADRWGLRVTQRTENVEQNAPAEPLLFSLDGVDPSLHGCVMAGSGVFRETLAADHWNVLASYSDKMPAILTRQLGKGRVVYLNADYKSHWYIQWVTPTGPERQGFYKLIEHLCTQAGAARTLRLEGDPNQALHVAVKQFTDETAQIRYVIARTSGEVPWTNSVLHWIGPGAAVYDVLGSPPGTPSRLIGTEIPLNFRPGQGRLLAITARPIRSVRVAVSPSRIVAGDPITVTVRVLDEHGNAVPGKFPLEIRVPDRPGLARSVSLASGESITINTALNDAPGRWVVGVTDAISGLTGSDTLTASAPPSLDPAFVPQGWTSEQPEPSVLSKSEFVDRLARLTTLYRTDQGGRGWLTKQILGSYYETFPQTRHSILRPLYDVDWPEYVDAWRDAIRAGGRFVLTGEDGNVDPSTGLSTYPHHDGKQLAAIAALLHNASWKLATRDGDTLVATLGKGEVILSRESIDAAGNSSPEAAEWQKRWLAELATGGAEVVKPMDESTLYRWWSGRAAATNSPRTVTWWSGNVRGMKLVADPARPLEAVAVLLLPPTGAVQSVAIPMTPDHNVSVDVGCKDKLVASPDWTAAVQQYLAWRDTIGGPIRDEQGWRLVPIRFLAKTKTDIVLGEPTVVVR